MKLEEFFSLDIQVGDEILFYYSNDKTKYTIRSFYYLSKNNSKQIFTNSIYELICAYDNKLMQLTSSKLPYMGFTGDYDFEHIDEVQVLRRGTTDEILI